MKKVLIITYYWPPSGGIGVLRCLKIAKYLRQHGWEPIVYTAENAHYPTIDHSNDQDIPEGITILKQPIWEPYALYKKWTGRAADENVNNVLYFQDSNWKHRLSVWIRSNFFIPDARASWIRPSVRFLVNYLRENPVDAILSDGPPHSNTRIATLVRKMTGIPWLADFQDPWTQVDYYQQLSLLPWADRKHHRLEREALQTADKTTIVSWTWKEDLEAIGATNVSVIPWGYDPDDYRDLQDLPIAEGFTLSHLGIMGYDRNPETLFHILRELADADPHFQQALRLQLVGQVDQSVQTAYQRAGIEANVDLVGSVSRQEALRRTRTSPVLLLLLNQQPNAKGRIPGKLFEYLAARRPILALGPPESDVAQILRRTNSGFTCAYDDAAGIRSVLEDLFARYRTGTLSAPQENAIEQYAHPVLVGEIAGFLEEIIK